MVVFGFFFYFLFLNCRISCSWVSAFNRVVEENRFHRNAYSMQRREGRVSILEVVDSQEETHRILPTNTFFHFVQLLFFFFKSTKQRYGTVGLVFHTARNICTLQDLQTMWSSVLVLSLKCFLSPLSACWACLSKCRLFKTSQFSTDCIGINASIKRPYYSSSLPLQSPTWTSTETTAPSFTSLRHTSSKSITDPYWPWNLEAVGLIEGERRVRLLLQAGGVMFCFWFRKGYRGDIHSRSAACRAVSCGRCLICTAVCPSEQTGLWGWGRGLM